MASARDGRLRRRGDSDAERLLEAVGDAIGASLDLDETLERISRLAIRGFADVCLTYLREGDDILRLAAFAATDPEVSRQLTRGRQPAIALAGPTLVCRVACAGEPEWLTEVAAEELEVVLPDPGRQALLAAVPASFIIAPLASGGYELGSIAFGRTASDRPFRRDEVPLAVEVARRAALAMGRAREHQTQGRVTERLALLARAGAVLTASLDWEATLHRVIDLALPALGDFGFFDVVEEEAEPPAEPVVRRLAGAPGDAELEAILSRTRWVRSERTDMNLCALSSGAAALHARTDEDWLRCAAASPEHLEMMRGLGFRSMMTVPLRYEQRLLGALTLFVTHSREAYTEDDLSSAQEIANIAASAVENARLYRHLSAKEAAVSQALAVARDAEQRKDDFLAMLGHEMRNPLAPILTAVELMRMSDPDSFRHEVRVIERQARHLVRLLDDLLDVSRIARGMVELRRAPVALADIVARAVETVAPLFEQRRHQLELNIPGDLTVSGDAHRLAQVFANLLGNAARYTDSGGRVEVRAWSDDSEATVQVIDDGAGIAPDLLPRLFDRFVQGERGADRAGGGLGLGLAIVSSLIELHGGTVRAESDGPGAGSCFTVTLPLAAGAARAGSGPTPAPPLAPELAPPIRVLVVDDNEDAAALLRDALASSGFSVEVAFGPHTAIATAREFDPDVAVLDIGLPEMDGYELARRLREAGLAPTLVALSGYGQPSDHERSLAAGFAAHLVKPVNLAELRAAIAAARDE